MQALQNGVCEQAKRLSKPSGIFVGSEERKNAYLEACRLLIELEPQIAAMRQSVAELIASAGASASLFAQCDPWRAFYEQTVTAFLSCVEAAADFEREGREAEPSRLLAACSDFCRTAEAFLKQYSDECR